MESFSHKAIPRDEHFANLIAAGEEPLYKKSPDTKSELLTETFNFFRDTLTSHGYTEYIKSNEAYAQLPNERIIARREDPRRIFELLNNESGYNISFASDRYANCVTWNPHTDGPKNLYNAFMEGFTNLNGVVAVIGFTPDEQSDLITMPDSVQNFHGLDRSGVRSYQGTVTQGQVRFITLRVPGHLIPETELTEDELSLVDQYHEQVETQGKATPVMIFRVFIPPTHASA